jgi:hypothetical protein
MPTGNPKATQRLLMLRRFFIIASFIIPGSFAFSQDTRPDSALQGADSMVLSIDDELDLDELFDEFELFLDSLLSPRSYSLISLSAGQSYFNFLVRTPRGMAVKSVKRMIWSPTFGYYDKSGLGLTVMSYMVDDNTKINSYQLSVSPSYDYIKNKKLATGISFTKYITKRRLPFYTSPLQNEFSGYFLWRKSWLQPGLSANYGWGSKSQFTRKDSIYKKIVSTAVTNRLLEDLDTVTIYRRNTKSIVDFSVAASLRHDFYWLKVFSKKDFIRLSPLLMLTGGTQKFGFNQTTGVTGPLRNVSLLNNSQNVSLEEKFQLLSMTLYLRSEYSIGKFFIQPQVVFDYYFPSESKNFMAAFSVNTGFMF